MADANSIEAARRYIRALARFWCNGAKGRGKLDPVYVEVTQGRDKRYNWAHWSSCGELSQAIVYALGCRRPFVNRSESPGGWRDGRNLLDFYDAKHVPSAPARPPAPDYRPGCGDIGFVWLTGFDAHTFVFGDQVGSGPARFETFNYGSGGMSPVEFPGAQQGAPEVSYHGHQIYVGHKILHQVLTVPALLDLLDPSLVPQMSGEVIDELEARV